MATQQEVDRIVRDNVGLVHSLVGRALRLYPRLPNCLEREDLQSIGNWALLKAAHTYDPGRGAAFSTYAYQCIKNEIAGELKRAADQQIDTVSLDQTLGPEEDDNPLRDLLIDHNADATRLAVNRFERDILETALGQLPERQALVIRTIYFDENSVQQVAAQWRLSTQAIQNIHMRALRALRVQLRRLGVRHVEG
jgi:RNA polymerase sigma factor for flagellar operon FliA